MKHFVGVWRKVVGEVDREVRGFVLMEVGAGEGLYHFFTGGRRWGGLDNS